MRNYVQPGDMITVTAPRALTSGDGVLIGSLFGVAAATYAEDDPNAEIKTTGVFDLAADPAATASAGAKAYWDATNHQVVGTATGNKLIGVFAQAKVATAPTARVRLDGIAI